MGILTLETNKYALKLDNFEGPLDLLCHLIDKEKLDIYDVKISDIADQYIEYINKMEKMNLEIASEFLVMASTLLYLKSKSLIPNQNEDDEEELTEEELIRQIIEYKKYKEITKIIRKNYEKFSKRAYKQEEIIELPSQRLEQEFEKNLIAKIYSKMLEKNTSKINKNAKNIEKIAITDTYTVASKVKEIYRELIKHKKFVFNQMYSVKKQNRQEVVTAFTGLLELSRRNKVSTYQDKQFGDITVRKVKRPTIKSKINEE